MQKIINVSDLFYMSGINHQGKINISHPDMTGLESHPKDDWLYLGLLTIVALAQKKAGQIRSAAFIGSGNGIETIAALKVLPGLKEIFVTDLASNIQTGIIQNICANAKQNLEGVCTYCLQGRDCQPLSQRVDLIYGNLPLIMFDPEDIAKHHLSLTTLTDGSVYMNLSQGPNDMLLRYSLLSQLGFLLSAKEKLNSGGSILTFIGGRVPYYAIHECFQRAGLNYRKMFTSLKRQSDGQFLKQYAEYEAKENVEFAFYDYKQAREIILNKYGLLIPEVITGIEDEELKALLSPALLSAKQAYEHHLQGLSVAHIAHAFEAWDNNNLKIYDQITA
jgi:hypothetical protein